MNVVTAFAMLVSLRKALFIIKGKFDQVEKKTVELAKEIQRQGTDILYAQWKKHASVKETEFAGGRR